MNDPFTPPRFQIPREKKIYMHTKTCTQMFIAATVVIDNNWKQPKCPDERMNTLIHTIIHE